MSGNLVFSKYSDETANNILLKIEVNNFDSYNYYLKKTINGFLSALSGFIGAKTDIDYFSANNVNNGKLFIHVYHYNENISDLEQLIDRRINTLIKFCETFDTTKEQTYLTKIVNILHANKVNLNSLCTLHAINKITKEDVCPPIPLILKNPEVNFKRFTVKRISFKDESSILCVNDLCAIDYGIYVNLTVPFLEMGMSYNALHLYEHLMMRCFKGEQLDKLHINEMNGATMPNGICYVFTTHNNVESLKKYLANTIKIMIEIRDMDYWSKKEQLNDIALETKRTISETRKSRTMNDFGRSDLHAYTIDGYNTEIFKYWSNKPFDIVVIGPNVSSLVNKEAIAKAIKKQPLNKVKRPSNIKYKTIPIDVLRNKEFSGMFTQKCDKEYIKELFSNNVTETERMKVFNDDTFDFGKYSYLYGLDCYLISLKETLEYYNTYAHPTVYLNKFYSDKELENILNKTNPPEVTGDYTQVAFFNKNKNY